MQQLERLVKVFTQANKELEKINSDIESLEAELGLLNRDYQSAKGDRQTLQEETEVMERRLVAAGKLISGLGSENERWKCFVFLPCTNI